MGRRRPLSPWKTLSCLARSSQLKHIFAVARPGSTPTTLLNSRVSLRRSRSLGTMSRLPVIHRRVFHDFQARGQYWLRHCAVTSERPSWALLASVFCYKTSLGYDLLCNTSTVMRRIMDMNVQTNWPRLLHLVSCQIKTYALVGHTLRSIPLRFCAM